MGSRPTTVEGVRDALSRLRTEACLGRALAFQADATDVFVASYPKTGTTWMQQIVHGLRSGGDMGFDEISAVVPWLESAWDLGIDPTRSRWRPRAFKTHFTRAEVPKGARYLYTLRDPADVAVSFFHFFEGWYFAPGSLDLATFTEHFFFEGSNSGRYWDHVRGWWEARDQGDTLFVCFEDLKEDLPGTVVRVADFLGLGHDHVEVATRQATFAFMRAHGRQFDEHLLRDARDAACGLPPGEEQEKLRAGRVGDAVALPDALRVRLDALWAETLGPLGLPDYPALREAVRLRPRPSVSDGR